MSARNLSRVLAVVGATVLCSGALGACHADPGDPDLTRLGPIVDPPGFFSEPLPGPDPWQSDESRLSMIIFYEGGFSESLPINGQTIHYYIYEVSPGGDLTYNQLTDDDRIEGLTSQRIVLGGKPWWGGGIHFDVAQDMRRWDTLHVSLKSSSAALEDVAIGMNSVNAVKNVNAADYGYAADGEWHTLKIPLADFVALGVNLGAVTDPFTLGGGPGTGADALKVDAFYFTGP